MWKRSATALLSGNRTSETTEENGQSRNAGYRYDADDRLIEESHSDANGDWNSGYTLDAAGNRLIESRTGSGGYAQSTTRFYTLNERNQIVAVDQSGGPLAGHTDYRYDADGHLLSSDGAAGRMDYLWNPRGHLVQASRNGSPVASYRYDPDGLREEQNSLGRTRRTQWIDGFAALDSDQAGNPQGKYEAGPNGRSPVALISSLGNEYLHADALGSITQSTAGGSVLASTDYDAWGNASQSGSSRNKFGYTGHQPDGETGLIYFKARYYDPTLGRFIGEDPMEGEPANPISWRSYLYANGNPLVYIDKDGNEATRCWGDCSAFRSPDEKAADDARFQREVEVRKNQHTTTNAYERSERERAEHAAQTQKNQEQRGQLTVEHGEGEVGIRPVDAGIADDIANIRAPVQKASQAGRMVSEAGQYALEKIWELNQPAPKVWVAGVVGKALTTQGGRALKKAADTIGKKLRNEATPAGNAALNEAEKKVAGKVERDAAGEAANEAESTLSRSAAFREAKEKAGIPRSQQPSSVGKEKLRDQEGNVEGRVYEFRRGDGSSVTIKEHSLGHEKGNHGPHFNSQARGAEGTKLPLKGGADSHTYFNP